MGYYMRCGKRWLQKNRFQCFLTPKEALLWLLVFSVHFTLSLHHLSIRTDTSTMPVIHSANRLHLLCMSWHWVHWVIEVLCKYYGDPNGVFYTKLKMRVEKFELCVYIGFYCYCFASSDAYAFCISCWVCLMERRRCVGWIFFWYSLPSFVWLTLLLFKVFWHFDLIHAIGNSSLNWLEVSRKSIYAHIYVYIEHTIGVTSNGVDPSVSFRNENSTLKKVSQIDLNFLRRSPTENERDLNQFIW